MDCRRRPVRGRVLTAAMPRRRALLALARGAVAAVPLLFGRRPVRAARPADQASGVARNLDETASWSARYCEVCGSNGCAGTSPCGAVPAHDPPTVVTDPSLDGHSLRLAYVSGPGYANVLYACDLFPSQYAGITAATAFTLDLRFLYRPATSFDNAGGVLSRIQAIEFAVRRWDGATLWDWEAQWDVVPAGQGGAPVWRVWGAGAWVETGVAQALAADQW